MVRKMLRLLVLDMFRKPFSIHFFVTLLFTKKHSN